MGLKSVFFVLMSILVVFSVGYSVQYSGSEHIILEGGKSGDVPFPHKLHQESLQDCNVCHELFGQEPGSIQQLISEGTLRGRQVMNTQCLKCHRDIKKTGNHSGPVTCNTCHYKPKQDQ